MAYVTITEELFEAIMARIAKGDSLLTICNEEGAPCRMTVMKYVRSSEETQAAYILAREECGAVMDEKGMEIINDALADKIKPDVARVAIGYLQWRAERLNQRLYGNRLSVDQTIRQVEAKQVSERIESGRKRLALVR